jgi:hypothetical protein
MQQRMFIVTPRESLTELKAENKLPAESAGPDRNWNWNWNWQRWNSSNFGSFASS